MRHVYILWLNTTYPGGGRGGDSEERRDHEAGLPMRGVVKSRELSVGFCLDKRADPSVGLHHRALAHPMQTVEGGLTAV